MIHILQNIFYKLFFPSKDHAKFPETKTVKCFHASTCMSMEVPVATKNNPRSKPLNGLISASICVRKFVSANNAPAKNAPSCT